MGCQQSAVAISPTAVENVIQPDAPPSSSSKPSLQEAKPQQPTPKEIKPDFDVELEKRPGDKLGVSLGNSSKGAVIFGLKASGLLERYNAEASEERKLHAGFIIVEVNGKRGYWDIFEEMRKNGPLKMVISQTPPEGASRNWFEEVESTERNLATQGSNIVVKGQKGASSSLSTVQAGDVGVDQCAICLADVGPNTNLVQLPCGHAFHVTCCGRWLTEKGRHAKGKKQCCPLCCRPVVVAGVGEGSESDVQN
jgi:hypothetical protein